MKAHSYLNCPLCGLSLPQRDADPEEHPCPRCQGQLSILVPMYVTEKPRPPVVTPGLTPQPV